VGNQPSTAQPQAIETCTPWAEGGHAPVPRLPIGCRAGGRGEGRAQGRAAARGTRLRTQLLARSSLHPAPGSMLRAAALAAAGLGPRLGRRLLSAAATQAVPTPNQQPEVFYNQVRPPLCSRSSAGPSAGRSLPARKALGLSVGGSLWLVFNA
jgi:hypothetical protein